MISCEQIDEKGVVHLKGTSGLKCGYRGNTKLVAYSWPCVVTLRTKDPICPKCASLSFEYEQKKAKVQRQLNVFWGRKP